MNMTEEELNDALTGRDGLLAFLTDKLNWPLLPDHSDGFLFQEAGYPSERDAATAEVFRLLPVTAADSLPVFLVEFIQGFSRSALREILGGIHQQICERGEGNTEEVVFVCAVVGDWWSAVSEDEKNSDRVHPPSPHSPRNQRLTPSILLSVHFSYASIHFAHYTKQNNEPAHLRSLSCYADEVSETHTLRTVYLPALAMQLNALGQPDWATCRKTWPAAWDEETLARLFFRDYGRIFNEVRDYYLRDVHGDRNLFAQRLFHRLLFVQFLTKKGWLTFQDRHDYLFALRDAAEEAEENYYRDRLYWVFFQGLGIPKGPQLYSLDERSQKRGEVPCVNIRLFEIADRDDIHRAVSIENEAFDIILDRLLGRYQFSCFESTPEDVEIAVDLEMFGKVLEKQVTERLESGPYHTPRPFISFLCREALKAYLTERTWEDADAITAFVEQQAGPPIQNAEATLAALKSFTCVDPACGSGAYLLGMLHELTALRQHLFVAKNVGAQTRYECKQEIIQHNLYGVDKDPFAINAAHLRLWLALVADGEVMAMEGLVVGGRWPVEEEEDSAGDADVTDAPDPVSLTTDQLPLPALDFSIVAGDSLAAPDPSRLDLRKESNAELISQFEECKRLYLSPQYEGDKRALRDDIHALREGIAAQTSGAAANFDWRVDFSGIFSVVGGSGSGVRGPGSEGTGAGWSGDAPAISVDAVSDTSLSSLPPTPNTLPAGPRTPDPGPRLADHRPPIPTSPGFDAIVTNPPGIRQEAVGRDYKEKTLKRIFSGIYDKTADLATYFYARAVQLLKPGGTLAFVSGNKWFRAASGAGLREYIGESCAARSITDFGDLRVFESASVYPVIFIAQKLPLRSLGRRAGASSKRGSRERECLYTEVKSLNPPYPDLKKLAEAEGRPLPHMALSGPNWSLDDARAADRVRIMQAKGTPLGEYLNGKVGRGTLTSLNTVYVIDDAKRDELIAADPNSEELIKPLATGRDIKRWAVNHSNQWLIVTRTGLDMTRYPAIMAHLNGWEMDLSIRQDKGQEFWEPHTGNYQAAFDTPKIYYQEIAGFPNFAFDEDGTYVNDEVWTIPTDDLYLLALLNSNRVWEYLNSVCPKLPNGALMLQMPYILSIPIPPAGENDREAMTEIARMCLAKKGVGVHLEEAEINRRVAGLYGG